MVFHYGTMTLKTKIFSKAIQQTKISESIITSWRPNILIGWIKKIFKLLCTSNRGLLDLTAPSHEWRKALICLHTTLGTKLCKQILSLCKEEITGEYNSLWKEESTSWWVQKYSIVPSVKSDMHWFSAPLPAFTKCLSASHNWWQPCLYCFVLGIISVFYFK